MKRIAFVLSLALTMFAVLSCGGGGAESVASYSNEIRVDDPMTVRLFDTFALKDDDQTVAAAKKAITVTPKIDFDVQIVDPQTISLVPKQPLDYNTEYKVTADFGAVAGKSAGKKTYTVKTLAPVLLFDYSKLTGYPGVDDRYHIDLEVTSPEVLDAKYLESGFSVKGADAQVAWVHSDDGRTHSVTVGNIPATDKKTMVELVHNWPRYSAEGSRRYEVPVKGQFNVVDSEV